jgi:hypothetical protein
MSRSVAGGTERDFQKSFGEFYATAENCTDDPDKEGKCQFRIHGMYDDTTNVPSNMLFWQKPHQEITSAGHLQCGKMPVGSIRGTVCRGHFLDADKQMPVFDHNIAKAGDLSSTGDQDSSSSTNGQASLVSGTNSTPRGGRIPDNAVQTRINRANRTSLTPHPIEAVDSGADTYQPNDSDGVNPTEAVRTATKFASIPTVASKTTGGSILKQLINVDPQNKNGVMPNCIKKFLQIENILQFSSMGGASNFLGQVMGIAMNIIGAASSINAMGSGFASASPATIQNLDPNTLTALFATITALGSGATIDQLDTDLQSIVGVIGSGGILDQLIAAILNLIQTNTFTLEAFIALIEAFLAMLQNAGQQATVGSNINNIMSNLASMLPTIASSITSSLDIHIPNSVLNPDTVNKAIQKFSMNQAIIKAPSTGLKILSKQAVEGQNMQNIGNLLSGISGAASGAISSITSALSGVSIPSV